MFQIVEKKDKMYLEVYLEVYLEALISSI